MTYRNKLENEELCMVHGGENVATDIPGLENIGPYAAANEDDARRYIEKLSDAMGHFELVF